MDFSFLKLLSTQLEDTKSEIEANWRLQILALVAGIAILAGMDVGVVKALTAFEPGDQARAEIFARLIVAVLLLYLFFRFGVFLGEYRDRKLRAVVARQLYSRAHRETGYFVEKMDQTNSQFDYFFWRDTTFVTIGITGYIAFFTSLMHGLGVVLFADFGMKLAESFGWPGMVQIGAFVGLAVIYWVVIALHYMGHVKIADASFANTLMGGDDQFAVPEDLREMIGSRQRTIRGRIVTTAWWTMIGALAWIALLSYLVLPACPALSCLR